MLQADTLTDVVKVITHFRRVRQLAKGAYSVVMFVRPSVCSLY